MRPTIMAALQMLATGMLSLRLLINTLSCPDIPGTCPALSIPLLQSASCCQEAKCIRMVIV